MSETREDLTKARELITYVCAQAEGDRYFGMKKLNKVLFAIDQEAYRRLGRTITGLEYQKQPMGPTLRKMKPILASLIDSESIQIRKEQIFDYAQERPFAWRPPQLTVFDGEEMAIVDRVLSQNANKTARQMELESHDYVGWQLVENGETIRMSLSLVSPERLNLAEWSAPLELEGDPEFMAFRRAKG